MGKPRRSFTREWKLESVKLVTEQGRSLAEAAANLGISESLLRKGKKDTVAAIAGTTRRWKGFSPR